MLCIVALAVCGAGGEDAHPEPFLIALCYQLLLPEVVMAKSAPPLSNGEIHVLSSLVCMWYSLKSARNLFPLEWCTGYLYRRGSCSHL